MSLSFTGIENIEFYSGHYLEAVLEGDLRQQLDAWAAAERDQGSRPPWKALESLANRYFEARQAASDERDRLARHGHARDFHAALVQALGYPYQPDLLQLAEDEHQDRLPVLAALERDGRPYLWIIDAPFAPPGTEAHDPLDEPPTHPEISAPLEQATLCKATLRELLEDVLFRTDGIAGGGPRWVLLLTGSEAVLAERDKWLQGRLLRFSWDELFRRRETDALKAVAGLLHKDVLAPDSGLCLHDTLDENSHKHAFAVSGDLKHGLRKALEILANEAVHFRRERRQALYTDEVFAGTLTRDSLNWLYRLLFLFYVEARSEELAAVPMKSDTYRKGYSLEGLRDLELVPLHTENAQNGFYLHDSLTTLFGIVQQGFPVVQAPRDGQGRFAYGTDDTTIIDAHGMRVPPLHSPLFDDNRLDALKGVRFRNKALQEVLQLLSLSQEGTRRRGGQRGRISYAQLGINQLGAVYESLLSYTGFFAKEDLYEVANKAELEKSGGTANESMQTWFVPASRIAEYDDGEIVRDQHGRKLVYAKGTFLYRLAGRHREKSASFYTPEVLTKCLVKYSLKELLHESQEDGSQGSPKFAAREILDLTICEPAMGSGAFLLEAVDQLADAYLARIQDETGERIPPADYQRHKRRVKARLATSNCHGVDLNPVAVELGKTSLWLGTIHEGGKCPWFGLRLATGNSLVGARRQVFRTADVTRPGTKTKPNWLDLVPENVPLHAAEGPRLGEQGWQLPQRPKGSIYHFLLPADGMAAFDSNEVVKELLPAHREQIRTWRKEFTKPFSKEQAARLEKLSDAIDRLWSQVCRERQFAIQNSTDRIPVWGEPGGDEPLPEQLEVQDQEALAAQLESSSSAYRRLKLAMDAWCALWFWPIHESARLPDREVWLRSLELILIGQVDARTVYRQGTFGDPEQVRRSPGATAPSKVVEPATAEVDAARLTRLKALSQQFEERRRQGADAFGTADVDEIVKAVPMLQVAMQVTGRLRFHHWELRFAEVFASRGGFDLILGNPPWVKLKFSPTETASDLAPHLALRPPSSTAFPEALSALLRSSADTCSTFLEENCDLAGQQNHLVSASYYPELQGQQPNLYKAFIARSLAISTRTRGVAGLIHPQGVFDHKEGDAWRGELFRHLRYYFQFENQLPLFAEVLHTRKFLAIVYGPKLAKPRGRQISNLVHPSTIDACFSHDGRGALPTQRAHGSWNFAGHAHRVLHIMPELLSLASRCFAAPEGERITNLYSTDHIALLEAISHSHTRIGDLATDYLPSEMLHEGSAQADGIIAKSCDTPKSLDAWVISGPHLYVGTLPYQNANPGCRNPLDYTRIDQATWDAGSMPRSPYSVARPDGVHLRILKGRPETAYYRLISRRMIDPSAERTLCPAVIPPGPIHIDACFSIAFETHAFAAYAWPTLSLPFDYWIKATGKTNFRRELADTLPILPNGHHSASGQLRLLLLACTSQPYTDLWERTYAAIHNTASPFPANHDRRLRPLSATASWTLRSALRSDLERRQALLEIDVLAACALGLNLETLTTVYRTSFGTLLSNEGNNLYDQHGRLVPTANTASGNPCVSLVKLAELLKDEADFDIHREYHPGADDTEQLLAKRIKLSKRDADLLGVDERCTVADLTTTTEVRWSSVEHPEGRLVPLVGIRYKDPGLEPRKERVYPTPWTRHSREADYATAWASLGL